MNHPKITSAPKDPTIIWSPRRSLRGETDLCPKVPDDFEQAWIDATMEELNWPDLDEKVETEPEDDIWYDEYLMEETRRAGEIAMLEDYEFDYGDHIDDDNYGDFADEVQWRRLMTSSTYDDWYY